MVVRTIVLYRLLYLEEYSISIKKYAPIVMMMNVATTTTTAVLCAMMMSMSNHFMVTAYFVPGVNPHSYHVGDMYVYFRCKVHEDGTAVVVDEFLFWMVDLLRTPSTMNFIIFHRADVVPCEYRTACTLSSNVISSINYSLTVAFAICHIHILPLSISHTASS